MALSGYGNAGYGRRPVSGRSRNPFWNPLAGTRAKLESACGILHAFTLHTFHAKRADADPNVVLARYGIERLLYRLSISPHRDRFVLKEALLLLVWFSDLSADALTMVFREVCAVRCDPDSMAFQHGSVQVSAIRENDQC